MSIHPTAIIDPTAEIGDNVSIGPYSIIGPQCVLHEGVTIHSHVVVYGFISIGVNTEVFQFSSIGSPPQDLKYKGEESRAEIGANCKIREHVTINTGTEAGGMMTKVGDNCLLMVGAHVAHDCILGNNVILVNNATLAGHAVIGDHAILGGLSAVHQFVRIGEHAFIGGMSGVEHDVIPYGSVIGNRARLGGLNLVGLRRRDIEKSDIHALRNAYAALFVEDEGSFKERVDQVSDSYPDSQLVRNMIEFIRAGKGRRICTPR
ncbi:MAG: acyl-[acyl-carrier-protein]--UDP-N-acetylglucosamine O-acyltransferase [Hyphomicrobiales bacterium]|nr:MAG: acyl-[acyl-carrier-protein]--UDP-N-acetylglucosamine O-acyltransferase [Hyphomicrobiales bacterium]